MKRIKFGDVARRDAAARPSVEGDAAKVNVRPVKRCGSGRAELTETRHVEARSRREVDKVQPRIRDEALRNVDKVVRAVGGDGGSVDGVDQEAHILPVVTAAVRHSPLLVAAIDDLLLHGGDLQDVDGGGEGGAPIPCIEVDDDDLLRPAHAEEEFSVPHVGAFDVEERALRKILCVFVDVRIILYQTKSELMIK